MTTTTSGGKMSARLALTMIAGSALTIGMPVKITGDYACDKGDATHPIIGYVAVPNVTRGSGTAAGTYPVSQVPGDVAVETIGVAVLVATAGATAITTPTAIKVAADGTYVPGAGPSDASFIGYALTSCLAAGTFDLLVV